MATDIVTYPEMNEKIVGLLRYRGDDLDLYAATRIEGLKAQVARLLERAQRAEAAAQEAVAREAVLTQALEIVWEARESAEYVDFIETGVIGWVFFLDKYKSGIVRDALRDRNAAAAALLERLAGLEATDSDTGGVKER